MLGWIVLLARVLFWFEMFCTESMFTMITFERQKIDHVTLLRVALMPYRQKFLTLRRLSGRGHVVKVTM